MYRRGGSRKPAAGSPRKPANVKVRPDGQPVLLDLGIAKDLSPASTAQTQTHTALGTSAWMAPEQADAKHGNHLESLKQMYSQYLPLIAQARRRRKEGEDREIAFIRPHHSHQTSVSVAKCVVAKAQSETDRLCLSSRWHLEQPQLLTELIVDFARGLAPSAGSQQGGEGGGTAAAAQEEESASLFGGYRRAVARRRWAMRSRATPRSLGLASARICWAATA